MSALVVLGSRSKLVGLVANTIANKVHFKKTLHLHTAKKKACSLAIDLMWVFFFQALD